MTRARQWATAVAVAAAIGCAEPERLQVGIEDGACPIVVPAGNGLRTELYDAPPEPYRWFPLLRSEPRRLGLSTGEQSFRVCESTRRSTWNHRNLWVRIEIDDRVAWLNAGQTRLKDFLGGLVDRRR